MEATADATWLGSAISRLSAVVTTPVPSRLLKIRISPTRAPDLRMTLAVSTSPVTDKPYFGSASVMECPPAITGARCLDRLGAATQYLGQDRIVQVFGPSDQIDGHHRLAAHGVHIAERVGCRDGAKIVGVVNNGREEIGRGNERAR